MQHPKSLLKAWNPTCPLTKQSGWIRSLWFCALWCSVCHFHGQQVSRFTGARPLYGIGMIHPDLNSKEFSTYNHFLLRFQAEVAKRGYLNLDTVKLYGHAALHQARAMDYTEGLIPVYLGLGSSYISKPHIDSSKYYYTLAIWESSAIRDTQLMTQAYAGYAYALVYDHSNYDGAIANMLKAHSLVTSARDTGLLIDVSNKLVAIYNLKNDTREAYKTCLDLIRFNRARKDTSALIYGYYMLGSLNSNLNLIERQKSIARTVLKWAGSTRDTTSMYAIYRTAADGYLSAKQYDSVLYYTRLNFPFCKKLNRVLVYYGYLGKTYLQTNQLDSARYYYHKMLEEQKSNGMYVDTYEYLDLGKIEFNSGRYDEALAYYRIAEANISKPALSTQREIYSALAEYFNYREDFGLSLAYLKKANAIADSIDSDQVAVSIIDYESAMYENQILSLTSEKERQSYLVSKQKLEKKIAFGSTGLILITAFFAFTGYRRKRDLNAKQALLNERLRISRELHDEVGGTLSGIAMYTHVAREQIKNAEITLADRSLGVMQTSANEMTQKLSDIVWLIHPEQDTISELLNRLEDFARHMTYAKQMQVKIDLPNGLSEVHIPIEARRSIYLFCKEAINNAVKYSQGNLLTLQVKEMKDKIVFSVSDDGIGFDEISIKNGNGLKNMRKRAEELNALFSIGSAPNKGSRIELFYNIIQ